MQGEKILVTGGTGFIGIHLVRELSRKGKAIRVLVRENSDTGFLKDREVELCYGDITDKNTLRNAVKDIHTVFHLAGKISNKNSKDVIDELNKINVLGTENLLRASYESGVCRFIHFSSVAVMGQGKNGVVFDELSSCGPTTFYGKSKYEAEKLVLKYREKGLAVTILRPAPVYGEGELGDMYQLIKLIKNKLFIKIGNGKNLRSLVYIGDLIDAVLLVTDNLKSTGQIYIVTDNRPYSLNEIINTIARELRIKVNNLTVPYGLIAPLRIPIKFITGKDIKDITLDRVYSSKKINSDLGFQAKVDFRDAIRRTIGWLKSQNRI